jgi:hypothetical protein
VNHDHEEFQIKTAKGLGRSQNKIAVGQESINNLRRKMPSIQKINEKILWYKHGLSHHRRDTAKAATAAATAANPVRSGVVAPLEDFAAPLEDFAAAELETFAGNELVIAATVGAAEGEPAP